MSADRRIGTLLARRARGELPLPDWEDELQLVHCEEILEQLDHGYLDADHCEHVAMIISEHYSLPARAESPQLRAHQMAAYVVKEAERDYRTATGRQRLRNDVHRQLHRAFVAKAIELVKVYSPGLRFDANEVERLCKTPLPDRSGEAEEMFGEAGAEMRQLWPRPRLSPTARARLRRASAARQRGPAARVIKVD